MKLTRRNFLKDGAITALALAVGLKPKAPPKPLHTPVSVMFDGDFVDSFPLDGEQIARAYRMPPRALGIVGDTHIGNYHSEVAEATFGPDFTDAQRQLRKRQSFNELYGGGAGGGKTGCGGFPVPPKCYKRLLAMSDTHYEADEQVLTYLGFVVTPMMSLKEIA